MARAILTVVTVVFNGEAQLAKTIESVVAQDYEQLEYIVIDGGSTDRTLEILQRHAGQISVVRSEPDRGIYDAMNKGARLASGQFILFMNCGDVFASPKAVSSAVQAIDELGEQVIFGSWIRRAGDARETLCRPRLDKGVFNHQAVIYSRSIHQWHGDYVRAPGLTTADYLFFATLFNNPAIACKTIDTTIAIIDVAGVSAGTQTLSQKFAIDFLCGRTDRLRLLLIIALHPTYARLKRLLRPLS